MLLAELNEHLALLDKRSRLCERLDALRASAQPGAPALSGLPRAPGYGDRIGDLAAEIADLSRSVDELETEIKASTERIEAFILGVDDPETRLVLRLRFLWGLRWKEVAGLMGPYVSEATAKRICYTAFSDAPNDDERP